MNHKLLDTEVYSSWIQLTFGISSIFQTGLSPTLIKVLTKHSALAQNTSNAEVVYKAFSNLLSCRDAYTALTSLVQLGRLPEAVKAVEHLESLVAGVPDFLKHTQIIEDLKVRPNPSCDASFLTSWSTAKDHFHQSSGSRPAQ